MVVYFHLPTKKKPMTRARWLTRLNHGVHSLQIMIQTNNGVIVKVRFYKFCYH